MTAMKRVKQIPAIIYSIENNSDGSTTYIQQRLIIPVVNLNVS